jgi:hypothetical protein
MARKVIYGLLAVFLLISFLSINATGRAQDTSTPQPTLNAPPIVITPGGVGVTQPGSPPSGSEVWRSALVLTWRDDGGVFTVPVNGLIILQVPAYPFSHLSFDPTILRLLPVRPLPVQPEDSPQPELTPEPPSDAIYPQPGWRLIAIRPGTTPLSVVPEPCRRPPCPMMPVVHFSVTIIVRGDLYPPPPPPPLPPPPVRTDVYIGTAYLNQTVSIRPGQVVTLDLPYLVVGQRVRVQFNPAILQPFPGENINVAQPGGWHFRVVGTGTTALTVRGEGCMDANQDCLPPVLFQVTLTTGTSG